MKNLSDYEGKTLSIIQPFFLKSSFELRDGEIILGTLKLKGLFGTKAETKGELFGSWEFYKPSFWKNTVDIRQQEKELPIARFVPKFFKQEGMLELPRGARLKIAAKIWKAKNEIQSESGETLVVFQRKIALKDKAEITLKKVNDTLNKYPWAVLLTWYIVQIHKRNNSIYAG